MEEEQTESIEMDVVGIVGDLEWIDSKPREKYCGTKIHPTAVAGMHCSRARLVRTNFGAPAREPQATRLIQEEDVSRVYLSIGV